MLRRVIVEGSTHVVIHATDIDGDRKGRVLINFSSHSFDYLRKIIKAGMRLNLLDCKQLTPNSMVFPAQIIVEPDFLIDISSIAACFKEYGHHPLNYTINRLGKNETSQPILLGNYAGAALDALLYGKDCSFAQVLTSCFCQQPLEYLTCTGFNAERFKSDAIVQAQNIKEIIDNLKGKYDLSNAILEPSFVCETLGIQGRVDMMTTDFKLLIEQKSGKNFNLATSQLTDIGYHIESHYVQLLLYFAVLYHNFSIKTDATDFYLLYSKYRMPTGLLPVNNYEILVEEAIKLRNQIVATELLIAEKGFPTVRKHLRSDVVNTQNSHSKLFTNYQKPQLDDLLSDIKDNDNHLLIKYFDTMATFVYREQRASWLGDSNEQTTAVSYLWKMTLEEKLESGNIFLNLRIKSLDENGLFAWLEYKRGDGFLPNFRRGDSVFLYEYKDTPDVRSSFLHKANILKITSNEIFIKLLNPLNTALFPIFSEDEDGRSYAIEHSSTNVSTSYSIRSLSAFLKSDTRKQQLLLGQRTPESDKTLMLSRQYSPDYDEIILGVKQAKDYYLLIGPPGTGKTSMALRFMVQEELATLDNNYSGSSALLLLSYTNRAVDEICEMLYGADIDFIRIGNEHTADEQWQQNLLSVKARSLGRLSALKQELLSAKVVVATTSTISSRLYLFSMKHFSTVIVDEASQILEPNIIGILSQNIGKFVLIGDYKQLPAVVQQSAEESLINDATLKDICLTD
ncbi:MAG: AAA family ATPase, partial [Bacteroidaceae bacterium]|nr:AAA family ATPase [Bacteroidaceae bacterium]